MSSHPLIKAAQVAVMEIESHDFARAELYPSKLFQSLAHLFLEFVKTEIPSSEELDNDYQIIDVDGALPQISENFFCFTLFEPMEEGSVVGTTLRDNLEAVYRPLKSGLRSFEQNPEKCAEIIAEWKDEFEWHTGRHLIDVIRYLFLSRPKPIAVQANL